MIFVKQRSSLFLQSVLCLLLVAPCMIWEKLGCVWSLAQVLLPLVVPSSMDLWKALHTVTQGCRIIASCARVAPCVPSCPSGRENGDLSMGFPLPVPHGGMSSSAGILLTRTNHTAPWNWEGAGRWSPVCSRGGGSNPSLPHAFSVPAELH